MDPQSAIDRVMRLMAVPGGSCKETEIAQAVKDELLAAGANPDDIYHDDAHTRTRTPGDIGNLFFKFGQDLPGDPLLLSAHLDTVPVCLGSRPERDGDIVRSSDPNTGLGADNRAGTAAVLTAAVEMLTTGAATRPITCCFFVQEEIGLQGSHFADPKAFGTIKSAVNFDGGTVEKLTIGATSGERIQIDIDGIAAHAGIAPASGVSAITIAAKAIAKLATDGWLGAVDKDGRQGTSNVGVIQGGDATNVITPKATVRAEARSHDGEFRSQITAAIQTAFETAAADEKNVAGKSGSITFTSHVDYESFRLDETAQSVVEAAAAIKKIGRTPITDVSNGGVDANWLFKHGVPAVTLGCGQRNVHTVDEQLVLSDYLDACRIAIDLCTLGS
jgi:tripeptide aminopeptidase